MIPKRLINDNQDISNLRVLAQTFNQYFSWFGKNVEAQMKPSNYSFLRYLARTCGTSFLLKPITPSEIEGHICGLHDNKIAGPNSIPARVLKIGSRIFAAPLHNLINMHLTHGSILSIIKMQFGLSRTNIGVLRKPKSLNLKAK